MDLNMKKITVAVAVDDKEGMTVFGKRQSRDRMLIADFVSSMGDKPIFISPFSKVIFEPYDSINIVEDPFLESSDGGACFIENVALSPYIDMIETLVIYRWNELYPSDVKLDVDVKNAGYKLISVSEFKGSSHDRITKETYEKN